MSLQENNPGVDNIFIDKKSGKQFRLFKYFDHEVIQDVETGWINAGGFVMDLWKAGIIKKRFAEFKSTEDYELCLEYLHEHYQMDGFPVYKRGYGSEVHGTYVPFPLFQIIALWANKKHKFSLLESLTYINDIANAKDISAYDVMNSINAQLQAENNRLKQERQVHIQTLDSYQDELLSRAETIDEQEIKIEEQSKQIHDLTTPKNKLIPTYLYAKKYGDYFHLKYKQINPHLIKNNIKQISMINAKDVKIDFMYYGKKLNLLENINNKWLCHMNNLELVFEILDKLKDNTFNLSDYQDTDVLIQEEIAKLKALPKTPQRNGKIFELEYCLINHLTPWEFIPSNILNKYHEIHSDTGIDFVRISDGNINEIGQVKVKTGNYLNRNDIETFISKCQDKQFQPMKKTLILKDAKIGKKLIGKMNELEISTQTF